MIKCEICGQSFSESVFEVHHAWELSKTEDAKVPEKGADNLTKLNKAQLIEIAAQDNIDISECKTNADLVNAITVFRNEGNKDGNQEG